MIFLCKRDKCYVWLGGFRSDLVDLRSREGRQCVLFAVNKAFLDSGMPKLLQGPEAALLFRRPSMPTVTVPVVATDATVIVSLLRNNEMVTTEFMAFFAVGLMFAKAGVVTATKNDVALL